MLGRRSKFSVFGSDNAPEGIKRTRHWLADEELQAELRLQSMTEKLPYIDAFFDAVIVTQFRDIHAMDARPG